MSSIDGLQRPPTVISSQCLRYLVYLLECSLATNLSKAGTQQQLISWPFGLG